MTRITIAGRTVDVIHETVGIESLKLNPDNPRIRFLLKHTGGKKDQKSLMKLIKDQPGYDDIQKAVRKSGGLQEAIIIASDGLVVEGNNRTTAVATLHEGAPNDKRWQTVPVTRLPRDIDGKSMAVLMAGYHIAGKTRWRAYAQAEHIHSMSHDHKLSLTQIAEETRMSEREVQQYLDAFNYLVNEVLPHAKNGNATEILESKFSHALEFFKTKKNEAHREDKSARKVLAKLIATNKIKGAEVREFDKVYSNRKSAAELRKSDFKAAKKTLTKVDPLSGSRALKLVKSATEALKEMSQSEIALFKKSGPARRTILELREAVQSVAEVIGAVKG